MVERASELNVFANGVKAASSNITVKELFPSVDLALIRVDGLSESLPHLSVATVLPDNLFSDRLRIYGFMYGVDRNLIRADSMQPTPIPATTLMSNDPIPAAIFAPGDVQIIEINMLIDHGVSGGPVLFGSQVIGVISGAESTGATVSWAIPTPYLSSAPHIAPNVWPSKIRTWPPLSLVSGDGRNMHKLALSGDPLMNNLQSFLGSLDQMSQGRQDWARSSKLVLEGMDQLRQGLHKVPAQFMDMPLGLVPKDDPSFREAWGLMTAGEKTMNDNRAAMNAAQDRMNQADIAATEMWGALQAQMDAYAKSVPSTVNNLALRDMVSKWMADRNQRFDKVAHDPDPPAVSANDFKTLAEFRDYEDFIVPAMLSQLQTVDSNMRQRIAIDREISVPVGHLLEMTPR